MHSQEYAYAYHDASPMDLPTVGWRRAEVRGYVELHALTKQLQDEMKALDYPRKDSFALDLVLREAVSNAFRHGNRRDRTRVVLINHYLGAEMALVEVIDEGSGFNPYLVRDLLGDERQQGQSRGRGLLLMRSWRS